MTDPAAGAGAALDVRNLSVTYRVGGADRTAVDDVSFSVGRAEILALIGESGSGKSTVARAIIGLHGSRGTVSGSIVQGGTELVGLGERELRAVRGRRIGLVFQDPLAALDPCFTVGSQIAEIYRAHRGVARREAQRLAVEAMATVGIANPARRASAYPHEFSGGMRQRVVIAMAIALRPPVLIADEPTSALDVTVEAQLLELLHELRTELGMAILLITHDVALAAEHADRIAVMYGGTLVETGSARTVYEQPRHPYTEALLLASPHAAATGQPLRAIEGAPASLAERGRGCAFAPRCPSVIDRCTADRPVLEPSGRDRQRAVACFVASSRTEVPA